MDHDQRFKTILREHFADFMRLFFAEWAKRMDLSAIEWLDKEVFPDPPEGSRHVLDLVARLTMRIPRDDEKEAKPEPTVILVHVEIESSERTTLIKSRMPHYYLHLRDKLGLPILPIVLFLKVGLNGIGVGSHVERLWKIDVIRFQYLYVGLPALDGIQYLQSENWLGVALSALMRIPPERVAWLGAEALRRLTGAPLNEQQRFLLAECVQAYLPMDEQQSRAFDGLLDSETYEGVKAMNKTIYEQGIEQGIEKGIEQGIERGRRQERLEIVGPLLQDKFGSLSEASQAKLEQMSAEELRRLISRIPSAQSLTDLGLDASE